MAVENIYESLKRLGVKLELSIDSRAFFAEELWISTDFMRTGENDLVGEGEDESLFVPADVNRFEAIGELSVELFDPWSTR